MWDNSITEGECERAAIGSYVGAHHTLWRKVGHGQWVHVWSDSTGIRERAAGPYPIEHQSWVRDLRLIPDYRWPVIDMLLVHGQAGRIADLLNSLFVTSRDNA